MDGALKLSSEGQTIKSNHAKTSRLYDWTAVKDKLHRAAGRPMFKVGQVWWCAIGENVGVEENGKSAKYSRPVLIIKKLNRDSFLCVPLTSVYQTGERFVNFMLGDKAETPLLSQIRVLSVARLYNYIGSVSANTQRKVTEALIRMLR